MGIDFQGGTLIEIKTKESPANLADIRGKVTGLGIGEVQIQEFGAPDARPDPHRLSADGTAAAGSRSPR